MSAPGTLIVLNVRKKSVERGSNKLIAILVIYHFICFLMSRQLVGNFGGSIKWAKKQGTFKARLTHKHRSQPQRSI